MNISLRNRLLLGIAAVQAVALVVAVVGLLRTEQAYRSLDEMASRQREQLAVCERIEAAFAGLEPSFHGPASNADTPRSRQIAGEISAAVAEAEAMPWPGQAPHGKALARHWREFQQHWREYLDAPGEEQRAAIYRNALSPTGARIGMRLSNLRRLATDELVAGAHSSRESLQTARASMQILLAGSFCASLMLVFVVMRWVLRPLRQIGVAIEQIEAGKLEGLRLPERRDEFGAIGTAIRKAAAGLNAYRRADAERLATTRQTTQTAIDSLPHAVAMLSPEGRVELGNALAARLFGFAPGVHINELNQKWLRPMFDAVRSVPRRLEPSGYDSAVQVFDASGERFFLPHLIPIMADGKVTGVTVVLVDATQLRRIDEAKSGLISMVSHELKTPLTSIQMCIHLLADEAQDLPPRQRELIEAAREDSDRLGRLIESLLDMGRLQAGRAHLNLESMTVSELIDASLSPLQPGLDAGTLQLRRSLPEALPPVLVDRERIRHAVENLLSNAAKYTGSGGTITISADAQEQSVNLHVSDTGIGIPSAYLPHIFEKFVRVPGNPPEGVPSGAGLGLAIAREIVHAHGGEITAESKEGQGSRFTISLRRADLTWGPEAAGAEGAI